MATPTVAVRCPSCGAELRAVVAPAPPTQWFPCPSCHAPVPVVVPRDLPPLYSWEVLPGLYPQLAPPRVPRWKSTHVASTALILAAALALLSAGYLGYQGALAAEPAHYVVTGVVYEQTPGGLMAAPGAVVKLFVNGQQFDPSNVTGANGSFRFIGVPSGGLELNVSASGYGSVDLYTFASRAYSTQTLGLSVTLQQGRGNTSVNALTPFGDLETLLAYVGGGAVLFGAAGVTAGAAAVVTRRPRGGIPGVIGAGAAVSVPAVLVLLSLAGPFPMLTLLASGAGGVGAFALVLAAADVANRGSSVEKV